MKGRKWGRWKEGRKEAEMDTWMGGWIDGWMHGWMDVVSHSFLQSGVLDGL
jgi:hypothetical protein